ncbi:MAG: NUDIX domain-containing protein [Minisyncoccia bacterium]
MKKEKFPFFAASHLILIEDDKVLLSRRFNTGWKDGFYSVIAGHIDGNETVAACMAREVKEEGNLDIREEDLDVVHTMHRITDYGAEYMDFFLVPKKWSGKPTIMEKDKCDELTWYPINSLPENMVPYIRLALGHIQNGVTFSEFRE